MKQLASLRVGIMQRVLPAYRARFFDLLADTMDGNLSVFAGEGRKQEMISAALPQKAHYMQADNHHFFKGSFYLCWQSNINEWLEKWQPQVLILEANPRYLHSPSAIRWMQSNGGKVIGWGLGAPSLEGGIIGALRKRFIHQFDATITYGSQGAEEYSALGIPPSRIYVAPNAAAAKPTHSLPKRPSSYRDGKAAVAFVGRLQERKRVDALIRACARLPEQMQPGLWIIGDGPILDDLKAVAKEIYPSTIFWGTLHGDELAGRLREADLFVLPGTGGLAVQEAMSFGLPVIVGEADGTQSDLVRPTNGWLLTDQTVETLQKLIARALKDVSLLRKKGAESYRIVSEEINLEKMAAVFRKAVDGVWNG